MSLYEVIKMETFGFNSRGLTKLWKGGYRHQVQSFLPIQLPSLDW